MSEINTDRRGFCGLAAAAATGLVMFTGRGSASPTRFQVAHTPAEWKRLLGAERYHILREGGTEPPFSSPLLKEHRTGTFVCAGCAQPLFSSATKFESGTGWPSFWKIMPAAIIERPDRSLGTLRTEVLCKRCGGHLGHVFNDGPRPTGLRYCMDGLALKFRPA